MNKNHLNPNPALLGYCLGKCSALNFKYAAIRNNVCFCADMFGTKNNNNWHLNKYGEEKPSLCLGKKTLENGFHKVFRTALPKNPYGACYVDNAKPDLEHHLGESQ